MTLNLVVADKWDVFFQMPTAYTFQNTFTLIADPAIIRPQFNDLCLRIKLKYMFENTVCEGKVVCKAPETSDKCTCFESIEALQYKVTSTVFLLKRNSCCSYLKDSVMFSK